MLADTNIEMVLGMLFLPFFNMDRDLQRACLKKLYNAEVISISHYQMRFDFIDKRDYAVVTLDSLK